MIVEMYPNGRDYKQELNEMIQSLGSQPVLETDEESALLQTIQAGGPRKPEALQKLVQANKRFVAAIAKQYVNKTTLPPEKLIEAGCKGLEQASARFDKSMGYKFIAYAVWWIRQSIQDAIKSSQRALDS